LSYASSDIEPPRKQGGLPPAGRYCAAEVRWSVPEAGLGRRAVRCDPKPLLATSQESDFCTKTAAAPIARAIKKIVLRGPSTANCAFAPIAVLGVLQQCAGRTRHRTVASEVATLEWRLLGQPTHSRSHALTERQNGSAICRRAANGARRPQRRAWPPVSIESIRQPLGVQYRATRDARPGEKIDHCGTTVRAPKRSPSTSGTFALLRTARRP
jgi:hypothetical protein